VVVDGVVVDGVVVDGVVVDGVVVDGVVVVRGPGLPAPLEGGRPPDDPCGPPDRAAAPCACFAGRASDVVGLFEWKLSTATSPRAVAPITNGARLIGIPPVVRRAVATGGRRGDTPHPDVRSPSSLPMVHAEPDVEMTSCLPPRPGRSWRRRPGLPGVAAWAGQVSGRAGRLVKPSIQSVSESPSIEMRQV